MKTETVSVEVHEFAGSVTVTVNVPTEFTVGVDVLPPERTPTPAQLNVAPALEEEPFNITVVEVQVNICTAPASAFGTGLIVTIDESVAIEHPPEAAIVFVTVYVPAVELTRSISPVFTSINTNPTVELNTPALAGEIKVGRGLVVPRQ